MKDPRIKGAEAGLLEPGQSVISFSGVLVLVQEIMC